MLEQLPSSMSGTPFAVQHSTTRNPLWAFVADDFAFKGSTGKLGFSSFLLVNAL